MESERLARRYFALFRKETLEELRAVVHPDVVLELQAVQPGQVLRGRDALVAFLEEELERTFWEPVAQVFTPIDEDRVVVEGRIRWFDESHVLRDDPRTWALEFRDGLVLSSRPARNVLDARTMLLAGRRGT